MGEPGRRTFWATVDRISNQGNGVVEKRDGSHFIVGPVKEEVVGKTVKVRMVGPDEAELADADLRKDVYAEQTDPSDKSISEGDIVSGRILKRSAEGVPLLQQEGIRIEVPEAHLNEGVEVKVVEISGSNSQWVKALGTVVKHKGSSNTGEKGTVIDDVELHKGQSITDSDTVTCPVTECNYTEKPASVAGHVSGTPDENHDWNRLGYDGAVEYKQDTSTPDNELQGYSSLLHISDTHLGASMEDGEDYSTNGSCLMGLRRAIDVAIVRDVDAVLNTGDFFHNDRHGIPTMAEEGAQKQLRRLFDEGISFFSIDGDHEREAGRKILENFENEGLVIRLNESPQMVGDGLALYGRDYTSSERWESTDWKPIASSTNRFGIVGIHQSITPISNNQWSECSVKDILDILGPHIHAIAAGHLHQTEVEWYNGFPFILGGTTEFERAGHVSDKPNVGQFIQDGNLLGYKRIRLPE